jgi:hypothetical protein
LRHSCEAGLGDYTAEARRTRSKEFLIKKFSDLCELGGHEKKFKNDENAKISLNEIEYLQVAIFAKIDFSHVRRLCGEYFFTENPE